MTEAPWTRREISLLGTKPDREVARLTGRSTSAVQEKRLLLRIPSLKLWMRKGREPVDPEKVKLLFGPYSPPRTRRGKFLFCEMRGTVKVGNYSDGPIPWPVKWGTRNSLILCCDLVRAVQVESAQGVAHHWGVRPSTVTRYRKALQVERYTTGTRQLYRGNFQERLLPQANRLGGVFARKPRIRVKIFRRLVDQLLHPKVRDVFRALIQRPNS